LARQGHLEAHHAIRLSTYGLFFLGTPHQGTDKASWGEILVSVASVFIHTNQNLLQHLGRDSEWLQQQLVQFASISNDFVTKFGYEAYPTPIAAGKSVLVSLSGGTFVLLHSSIREQSVLTYCRLYQDLQLWFQGAETQKKWL
jgi:hypothetical protein